MKVAEDQGPGKTSGAGLFDQVAKPQSKTDTILIIIKNLAALDPFGNDMMRCARSVYSGLSGHASCLAWNLEAF